VKRDLDDGEDRVVPLGVAPPAEEPVAPSRPHAGHGLAITGMALFALIGIAAIFLFISIEWPENTQRYIAIIFVAAGIGFLACASTAVFTAARDTYRAPQDPDDGASE
jgi:cation transporter-like permease